jgi:hypothetical protein
MDNKAISSIPGVSGANIDETVDCVQQKCTVQFKAGEKLDPIVSNVMSKNMLSTKSMQKIMEDAKTLQDRYDALQGLLNDVNTKLNACIKDNATCAARKTVLVAHSNAINISNKDCIDNSYTYKNNWQSCVDTPSCPTCPQCPAVAGTNCYPAQATYLKVNQDVANAGMNAWIHYMTYGKNEGRSWPPCDPQTAAPVDCPTAGAVYLKDNPDVANARMNAWYHYTTYGKNEKRPWPPCNEPVPVVTRVAAPPPAPIPPPQPPAITVSQNGRCGPSFNNTKCPPGQCCSTSYWCANSQDHCATYIMKDQKYQGDPVDTTNSPSLVGHDQWMASADKRHIFKMQADGNIVLYNGNRAIWHTNTYAGRAGRAPYRLTMQADGNLVGYNADNRAFWASGTWGKGTAPFRFAMQNDGNAVIYDRSNRATWATGTWGR